MTSSNSGARVHSCEEVGRGAEIEARVKGAKHFEGLVIETHPKMRLFWAVSSVGVRRLIEFDEYEVYRLV